MGGIEMDINKMAAIATIIGAIATIISTVIAVRAKEEAKSILKQIKEGNIKNSGKIEVKNNGQNSSSPCQDAVPEALFPTA